MLGFVELDGLAGYKGMFCNNSLLYIPNPNFIAQLLTLLSCFVACIFICMSWRFCKMKSTDLKYLLKRASGTRGLSMDHIVSSIYSNLYHRIYFCIYYFHVGNIQLKKKILAPPLEFVLFHNLTSVRLADVAIYSNCSDFRSNCVTDLRNCSDFGSNCITDLRCTRP